MSRTTIWILVAAHITVMTGCSTASKDIASSSVSPLQYQPYDCDQLAAESQRVHLRTQALGARLDEASSNDKVLTGVGLILFWPALFALGGTKEQEAEYARLKGEYDAVQQVAIQKKCPGLVIDPATAQQVAATPETPHQIIENADQALIVSEQTTAATPPATATPDQTQ